MATMVEYHCFVWCTLARHVLRVFTPFAYCILFLSAASLAAEPNSQHSIYVVTSHAHEPYQREIVNFSNALRDALPNYTLVLANAQQPLPEFDTGTAAVITIGSDAAQRVAKAKPNGAVLHLFVTEGVLDKIYERQLPPNVSAILLEQPFQRYADAVKTLFPNAEGVAILYGPVSVKRKPEYDAILKQKGLTAKSIVIDENQNASRAIEKLLEFELPVIAVPDSVALPPSNSKWLLYTAYRKRIPVIVYSHAFLVAGATVGVYSTPEQILQQALETAKKILLQKEYDKEQQGYPQYFDIVANKRVAESMSITFPSSNELKIIE